MRERGFYSKISVAGDSVPSWKPRLPVVWRLLVHEPIAVAVAVGISDTWHPHGTSDMWHFTGDTWHLTYEKIENKIYLMFVFLCVLSIFVLLCVFIPSDVREASTLFGDHRSSFILNIALLWVLEGVFSLVNKGPILWRAWFLTLKVFLPKYEKIIIIIIF